MILFQEHFDGYDTQTKYRNAVSNIASAAAYVNNGGKWGGGCLQANATSVGDTRALIQAPAANLIRFMFWMKSSVLGSATGTRPLFRLTNTAGDRFVNVFFTGSVNNAYIRVSKFDDVSAAVNAFDGSTVVNDGEWHHVEVEMTAATSGGVLKVWIDGVLEPGSITSGDTSDAASGDLTSLDRVVLCGCSNNTGGATQTFLDDVIVWDDQGTDFTGAFNSTRGHRLRRISPTADGSLSQWTPLSSTNFSNVDDAANDDDTTYVSETTTGEIDLYKNTSLGFTLSTILALFVENISKIDTGTHTIRNKLKISGTTYSGATSAALTTTYRKQMDPYGKNPNTTAAWTQSDIQGMEWGQEMVS